jgi:hypothetical protein
VLDKKGRPMVTNETADTPKKQAEGKATCSCGSAIPAIDLAIDSKTVKVVALPLIFRKFRESGRALEEVTAQELLETVKVYNFVPPEDEESYREAVIREYAAYCERESEQ